MNAVLLVLLGMSLALSAAARAGDSPAFITIPAAKPSELTKANGWPAPDSYRHWTRSLGGPSSNRFSALTSINRKTIKRLAPAWTYRSGDGTSNIQCNPIVVDGVMFAPTGGGNIVAIDAAKGTEIWRFAVPKGGGRPEDRPARRGLLHWPGDGVHRPRLIFGAGDHMYALDPCTGKPIENFGDKGRTPVPMGTTVAGAVHRSVLVVPGYRGDVYGFDIRNGERLWTFATRPRNGEFGSDTWHGEGGSGANCWGGMAMDESRGIAFVSTGSPKPNYLGMGHMGDNLFANCVIALDALTGKRLWHFQEIRHDVWDFDIPAPPNLVTVLRDGVKIDAVAQVTKLGNTLLLDRVSGKPLFPFRLGRIDSKGLPGDKLSPYQPMPELPEPFARIGYTEADLPVDPQARAAVEPLFRASNSGPYPSLGDGRTTISFNIHGGAEWTGAAVDPHSARLYVNSNEIPWQIRFVSDDDPEPAKPQTAGHKTYATYCSACHQDKMLGMGHIPSLRGLRHRMDETRLREVITKGIGTMPPMPHLPADQLGPLVDFLLCRDRPGSPKNNGAPSRWTFGGFKRFEHDGYPAAKPPWGTLSCIDLNTGRIAWRVPLGEYEELTRKGVPKTGQENFGGALVTAGGLVFVSGTRDRKIRAFDADTGAELWKYELPLHGTAPPASYEVAGRQYIVLPVTGGGKLGGPTGDIWMAFALKEK